MELPVAVHDTWRPLSFAAPAHAASASPCSYELSHAPTQNRSGSSNHESAARPQPRNGMHCLRSGVPLQHVLQPTARDCRSRHGVGVGGCAARASTKLRIMLRRLWIGMSALLSSLAPVFGEVSLVRSHSVMAARS